MPIAAETKAYTPPAIVPASWDDGKIAFFRTTLENPLTRIPAAAYQDDIAVASILGTPIACITEPQILEEILIKRPGEFPKSEVDDRIFEPAFGKSLLVTHGEDWRWKRRLAAPYFAPAALAKILPDMIAPFEALAVSWRNAGTQTADVSEAMTEATLAVIAKTLFTETDARATKAISSAIAEYLDPIAWVIVLASLKLPAWVPHPGMFRIRSAQRQIRKEIHDLIVAHRQPGAPGNDFCADLMQARDPETGRPLTDEDLIDMLATLIAAGHETSSNALTWMLFCLAEQPELQEDLRREAGDVVADRNITAADLAKLTKLEAFAKETMRLFPPAPLMARQTTKAETLGGETFAPGTTLFIPIYAIHRHKKLWHQPDRFDLTRFLGDAAKRMPRTTYMPFGAGPRICIGATFAMMEIVGALATLLRHVRVATNHETRCEPIQRITLRPKDGLKLSIQPL